ncbi:MAG: TRAP transporter small permease [Ectothiorhodospiraceae bacterium]|nr:TRAP transporter small permease [Ectothiorhodospiraceae bacterium]
MQALLGAVDRLSQTVGLSVAHFYFVCALITAYEVIMRYVFHAPTLWAFEVVMVVCACAWALSGAYVTMRNSHISITVVYQYSKGKARWWLDLFHMVVTLGAMGTLGYAMYGLVEDALHTFERSGTSFNSPEPMIIKLVLFAGVCLYCLQTLVNLIRHVSGLERPARPLPQGE